VVDGQVIGHEIHHEPANKNAFSVQNLIKTHFNKVVDGEVIGHEIYHEPAPPHQKKKVF
jgi:hypothetical protein